MMGAAENISDLRTLLSIVAEETGALKMSDADEDSVGWTTEGQLPMTFGHVRRAHSALAALEAALSAAEPVAWLVKRYDLEGILLDTELSFVRPTIKSTSRTDMVPLYAALSAQVQDVAGTETTVRFHIEWIAGARPPVHPNPMTGRATFESFELAVQHMKSQADDAQFVSLEERRTTVVSIDRSADMRAALPAAPAKQEGRRVTSQ